MTKREEIAYSDDVDPIPGILTPLILVQGLSLPMT